MNQTQLDHSALSRKQIDALQINALQLDNDFWQFSLRLWKSQDLQSSLLALQDQQDFRINLLLFAMWLGLENKLIKPHISEIKDATNTWHEQIVAPLRKVRKSLPKHSLRKEVQQTELQAEQIEQAILFDLSSDFEASPENNRVETLIANLFASRLPQTHLLLCIQTCLPEYSEAEIQPYIGKYETIKN